MEKKYTGSTIQNQDPEDIFAVVEPGSATPSAPPPTPAPRIPSLPPEPQPQELIQPEQSALMQTSQEERPVFTPVQQVPPPAPPNMQDTGEPSQRQPQPRRRMGRGSKIRLIVGAILLFIAAIVGFIVVYPRWFGTTDSPSSNINQVSPIPTTNNTNSAQGNTLRGRDSDGDGLLDEEEIKFKTNPNRIDSDTDGLTDRQEIHIYQTDPLNDDTDGDRFLDGEEVRHLYNPKGKGKLLDPLEDIKKQEQTP